MYTYDNSSLTTDEKVEQLVQWIKKSKRGLLFIGAGISTDSGIPDYNSDQGIWSRNLDFTYDWDSYQINPSHEIIAEFIEHNIFSHIISTNFDGLMIDAGVPENKITEIHGNINYFRCWKCDILYSRKDLGFDYLPPPRGSALLRNHPKCTCGGFLYSSLVEFGFPLSNNSMQEAREKALDSDFVLIIGSTLSILPASLFPKMTVLAGDGKMAVINRGSTSMDHDAGLKIDDDIATVLSTMREKLLSA